MDSGETNQGVHILIEFYYRKKFSKSIKFHIRIWKQVLKLEKLSYFQILEVEAMVDIEILSRAPAVHRAPIMSCDVNNEHAY